MHFSDPASESGELLHLRNKAGRDPQDLPSG